VEYLYIFAYKMIFQLLTQWVWIGWPENISIEISHAWRSPTNSKSPEVFANLHVQITSEWDENQQLAIFIFLRDEKSKQFSYQIQIK